MASFFFRDSLFFTRGVLGVQPLGEGVAEATAAKRGGWSEGKAFPSFMTMLIKMSGSSPNMTHTGDINEKRRHQEGFDYWFGSDCDWSGVRV